MPDESECEGRHQIRQNRKTKPECKHALGLATNTLLRNVVGRITQAIAAFEETRSRVYRINGLSQTRSSSALSWLKCFGPSSALHSCSIS